MSSNYRHAPIVDTSRKRCIVCHHAVYSASGIHPQCAVRLFDPPQQAKKKVTATIADATVADASVADAPVADAAVADAPVAGRGPGTYGRRRGR